MAHEPGRPGPNDRASLADGRHPAPVLSEMDRAQMANARPGNRDEQAGDSNQTPEGIYPFRHEIGCKPVNEDQEEGNPHDAVKKIRAASQPPFYRGPGLPGGDEPVCIERYPDCEKQ